MSAVIGAERIALGFAPSVAAGARVELGIRPEFVRLSREGHPVTVTKVEDIGRQRIVRATFAGRPIAAIVAEDAEVPAEPRVRFAPEAINVYADSWRVSGRG